MRSLLAHSLSCSLLLAASGLSAVACGGSATPSSPPAPATQDVVQSSLPRDMHPAIKSGDLTKLVQDNTTFAFDLYQAVTAGAATGNLFYSPYSISIALAMTYNGAAGSTATEMSSALQFNQPLSTLNNAFDQLDLHLASLGSSAPPPSGGHPFHLNVADSAWGDKTFTFLPGYLNALSVDYGSNVHVVNFEQDPDAARTTINDWVSTATDAKIPTLLPDGSIDPTTRFVLVNAIYFDAAWNTQFAKSATATQPFTRLDGSTVKAPIMNAFLGGTGYVSTPTYSAIELPYDGGQTSMIVVVPTEGKFASIASGLSGSFYQTVTSSLESQSVQLGLPKFTISGATISLKDELSKMGMPDAFNQDANFSALAKEPISLGDVLHQAFVSVDEEGTQAAAATAVIGVGLAAPSHIIDFTVDHPFFFFIRDVSTNTVLFAGQVTDPTL